MTVVIRGVLGWGNRKAGLEAYGPGGRWEGEGTRHSGTCSATPSTGPAPPKAPPSSSSPSTGSGTPASSSGSKPPSTPRTGDDHHRADQRPARPAAGGRPVTGPRWTVEDDGAYLSCQGGRYGITSWDVDDDADVNLPDVFAALVQCVRDADRLERVTRERDALLAMVECCQGLVPDLTGEAQEELAAIVGWPRSDQ